MPDYTVKADVDTMLRADNKAAIRSAIGVGTTDAPTFLGVGISASGGAPSSGMAWDGSTHLAFFHNGVIRMVITSPGPTIGSAMAYAWGSASVPTNSTRDLTLFRDDPGILAQRNGVNAQAFRVYNAYYGTTADEWGAFDFKTNAGTLTIGTQRLSTGGLRNVSIVATGATIQMAPGNTNTWKFDGTTGSFLANSDNAFDIGASGANRPRNVYLAQSLFLGSRVVFGFDARIVNDTAGVLRLVNGTETDFNRLQLGGTTDAFPAIARDGAGIKFTGAAAGSTSWIKVPPVAVSALPSAATAGVGARSFVNDALTPVFGSAVTGGGAVTVPVYSTGSAWNVG